MKILLQFPEGLKQQALEYVQKYKKQGHEVYLASAPCYGACDLALEEAKTIKADKLIHFGHTRFIKKPLPFEVEYVEYHLDVDLDKLQKAAKKLEGFKSISLGTTVQHIHQFNTIVKIFSDLGITVLSGNGNVTYHKGQVLGCDGSAVTCNANNADALVFIGDGMFHALAIDNNKPVFVVHPFSGEVKQINDEIEKLRKKKRGAIIAASSAKTFGILISTKPGQENKELAKNIEKELEKRGKTALLLISNEFNPLSLGNFTTVDCYINTACPRIADDKEMFEKPIINACDCQKLFELIDGLSSSSN